MRTNRICRYKTGTVPNIREARSSSRYRDDLWRFATLGYSFLFTKINRYSSVDGELWAGGKGVHEHDISLRHGHYNDLPQSRHSDSYHCSNPHRLDEPT